MEEFKDKMIIDAGKYKALQDKYKAASENLKEKSNEYLKANGYFCIEEREREKLSYGDYLGGWRGSYMFFKYFDSVKFYEKLENTKLSQIVKTMEEIIYDYENKMLELFRVIADKETTENINLKDNFTEVHFEKIQELDDKMRAKIWTEEKKKLETEKTKKLENKLDKIPYWIRVICNAI